MKPIQVRSPASLPDAVHRILFQERASSTRAQHLPTPEDAAAPDEIVAAVAYQPVPRKLKRPAPEEMEAEDTARPETEFQAVKLRGNTSWTSLLEQPSKKNPGSCIGKPLRSFGFLHHEEATTRQRLVGIIEAERCRTSTAVKSTK